MCLDTCPNQFAFKKGHSTDMCIYVLKEFIEFYRSPNTSADSKTHYIIDHWRLFNKLLNIHAPVFIISILVYWYSRQEIFIRWGNSCSTKYRVTNGVKQGGILFPALFNVYKNNLGVSLNHSATGYYYYYYYYYYY